MNPLFLGLDIGTTGIKCVAFDKNLSELAVAYREYDLHFGPESAIEQDANEWLALSLDVINEVINETRDLGKVKAIGISSQGISFVPVNENNEPMGLANTWLDARGNVSLPQMGASISADEFKERTGKPWLGKYVLPKLLMMRDREPERYESATAFYMPHEYVAGHLCGSFVTDHTMAGGTMLYNLASRSWDEEIADTFNVPLDKLAPIQDSGTIAGKLNPELINEWDLNEEVLIAVGGQDQKCASFAAGLNKGRLTLSLGTAAALHAVITEPAVDLDSEIGTFAGIRPGQWILEAAISTGGASLKWLRDLLSKKFSYDELNDLAAPLLEEEPGLMFMPYLSRMNGMGSLTGLSLDSGAGALAYAVMEGVALEVNFFLMRMRELTPTAEAQSMQFFGGGATSPVWSRIMADVTGLPIEVPVIHEAAAAGAAILAGQAMGYFQDKEGQSFLPIKQQYQPNPHRRSFYDEKMKLFIQARERMLAVEN
ncbi:MAG: FGGY-family carbohydrate kinase [Clostridiaceae bacterium]|nr:FGGY-family carbohydrate kinase [Clostridiaceae bacterium]